jgi:hypothetical protein
MRVMDRLEPPRIGKADSSVEEGARARFHRFSLRPNDLGRGGNVSAGRPNRLIVVVGVVLLAGLIYLGNQAVVAVVRWLHGQSQYQVPFDQIELIDPPPAWYRGGSKAFREHVRRSAGAGELVPMLDITPDRLEIAFKNAAWVEEVVKVAYVPGRITVQLKYAEPVAWVKLPESGQQLVDARGVLLDADDVDPVLLGPLIRITGGAELRAPADARAGVIWKSRVGPEEPEQVDESIVAAARLAGFITRQRRASAGANAPALKIIEVMVKYFKRHGLFMVNGERTVIWWRHPLGAEPPGEPDAEEKWAMLREWQRTTTARALPDQDYWRFDQKSVVPFCPHGDPTHRPREPGEPKAGATDASRKPAGSG